MNDVTGVTSPGRSWARSLTLYFPCTNPVMLAPHGAHCPAGELLRASKTEHETVSSCVTFKKETDTPPKMSEREVGRRGVGGFSEECHLHRESMRGKSQET